MIRDGLIKESEERVIRLGSASTNRNCLIIIEVISIGNNWDLEGRNMLGQGQLTSCMALNRSACASGKSDWQMARKYLCFRRAPLLYHCTRKTPGKPPASIIYRIWRSSR